MKMLFVKIGKSLLQHTNPACYTEMDGTNVKNWGKLFGHQHNEEVSKGNNNNNKNHNNKKFF
jgi:hypothetical protein